MESIKGELEADTYLTALKEVLAENLSTDMMKCSCKRY